MKENIIKEKSFLFAVRTIRLCQFLLDNKKEFVLNKQVLRNGIIGAMVRETEYITKYQFQNINPNAIEIIK